MRNASPTSAATRQHEARAGWPPRHQPDRASPIPRTERQADPASRDQHCRKANTDSATPRRRCNGGSLRRSNGAETGDGVRDVADAGQTREPQLPRRRTGWRSEPNGGGSPAAARNSPAAVGCSRLLGFVATHTDRSVHRAGARAACVRAGDPPGTATATGTSHGPRAHANRFEPPR